MPEPDDLTLEERVEIEATYFRLSVANYYELLGVDRHADRNTIINAAIERMRRYLPAAFKGRSTGSFQGRIEAIVERMEEARDTLVDPLHRFAYDQGLAAAARENTSQELPRSWRAAEAGTSVRPPSTPAGPRSHHPGGDEVSGQFRAPGPQPLPAWPAHAAEAAPLVRPPSLQPPSQPPPHAPSSRQPPPEEAVVPAPLRRVAPQATPPLAPPMAPVGPASPGSAASRVLAPPPVRWSPSQHGTVEGAGREGHLPTAADFERLVLEVGTLLTELNVVMHAVEFCIAHHTPAQAPQEDSRRAAVARARATFAAMLALREEQTGSWSAAAAQWKRACRAAPNDASHHAHAADALLRADEDLDEAEQYARRAVELDPDLALGHATLAIVLVRRGQ